MSLDILWIFTEIPATSYDMSPLCFFSFSSKKKEGEKRKKESGFAFLIAPTLRRNEYSELVGGCVQERGEALSKCRRDIFPLLHEIVYALSRGTSEKKEENGREGKGKGLCVDEGIPT